jgi:two-component system, sensor histidine kinase and response regulator
MTPTDTATSSIMVVDDQPANLKLLEDMLKGKGYAIRSFPRGRLALASAAQNPPDLILLDINMPEMTGFEVCERLKSDSRLARIPVVFLSALNETEDKIKAFRSGGVDYVTKPFQLAEVQARVETHLELHRLHLALERQNDRLEETVRSRTRELAEAHARLKILDQSKSDFLRLISHELRTPLNGILGVAELIVMDLQSTAGDNLRAMFGQSRARLLTILDHALLLTQIEVDAEKFTCERVSLAAVLRAAREEAAGFASYRQVTIDWVPMEAAFILGNHHLLVTALRALLDTAVKFSEAGGNVRLACDSVPGAIRIAIESRGRAVPDTVIPKFFDLLAVGGTVTPGGDLGLDPPIAHRILALFGGSVTIRNLHPAGIQITVSLRSAPVNDGL